MQDHVGVFVAELVARAAQQQDPRRIISHALDGLTTLTPAQVSAFTVLRVDPPASPAARPGLTFIDVIEGGSWPADARQSYMNYLNDEAAGDPFLERLFHAAVSNPGVVTSMLRREAVDDATWYNSPHYVKYRGAVGFDDCLYTAIFTADQDRHGLPPGHFVGIGLHALRGEARFSQAHGQIARIAVHAALPLIAMTMQSDSLGAANLFASLTPRQRDVLLHLNEGLSTKQIADRLSLTPVSVQTYIQALCKRLGVRGQREAVALCNRKGWLVRTQPVDTADTAAPDAAHEAPNQAAHEAAHDDPTATTSPRPSTRE
jgi:DNA-binding CsgD family transcriptional regulator